MPKKILKNSLFLLFLAGLSFADLAFWRNGWAGLVIFLLYLGVSQHYASLILIKFFNFSKLLRTKILSGFFVLMIWWSALGAVIIFARLTALAIAASMLGVGLFFLFLAHWAEGRKNSHAIESFENQEIVYQNSAPVFLSVIYLALVGWAFYLLAISRTGAAILTPWQTINQNYIYVFFGATLILGALIFSKLSVKTLLGFLIIHTFLLHAYLPLTHDLLYGADQWRHMGTELTLAREQPLNLKVYGANFSVSSVGINPGSFSYSQFWGAEVMLSRLLNLALVPINAWFVPIIWSLIFPILLFELASFLGHNKRRSLFLVWLGFLPFAWQASGSFSLPSNLGFLFWLFLLLLLLRRANQKRWEQGIVLCLALAASIFGYALYLVLFIAAWFLLALAKSKPVKLEIFRIAIVFLGAFLVLPMAELMNTYFTQASRFSFAWGQLKQMVGNFTAYFLARGPRPHVIDAGNVIFNQTPAYAFVANFFTSWRWWLVILMLLFFAATVWGIKLILRRGFEYKFLAYLLGGLFCGYLLTFYFFSGEKIFSRRMDSVIALLFIILLFAALCRLFDRLKNPGWKFAVILLFSCAISAAYSLGPDTVTVSTDELSAMRYVWQDEKNFDKHCVLAGTMPLLGLEALSAKQIIGGGFPINNNFAQPELTSLYSGLNNNFTPALQRGLVITGAPACWVVGDFNLPGAKAFGKVKAWKFNGE